MYHFNSIYYNVGQQLRTNKQNCHAEKHYKQNNVRGTFNKFQNYVFNITTVNRTLLLLFNIFSLQFTAVFPLFYKSAGTRKIVFVGTCRNFQTQSFSNRLELFGLVVTLA